MALWNQEALNVLRGERKMAGHLEASRRVTSFLAVGCNLVSREGKRHDRTKIQWSRSFSGGNAVPTTEEIQFSTRDRKPTAAALGNSFSLIFAPRCRPTIPSINRFTVPRRKWIAKFVKFTGRILCEGAIKSRTLSEVDEEVFFFFPTKRKARGEKVASVCRNIISFLERKITEKENWLTNYRRRNKLINWEQTDRIAG